MGHLSIFESKFSRLKEDRDNVMRAKEALELQEPGIVEIILLCINNVTYYRIMSQ